MRRCVIDIESSGLISDMVDFTSFPYKLKPNAKMWCVVITDIDSKEVFHAVNEEITKEWMESVLGRFNFIVAHNGHKFDLPTLKLFGLIDYKIGYLDEPDTLFGREVRFIDTLVLSRLVNPDRFGGHSLSAWGQRLGNAKVDFRGICIEKGYIEKSSPKGAEFKTYCPEMLHYCIQDTLVNIDIFHKLVEELRDWDWKMAIKQEHKLADLSVAREYFGFWFDKELALSVLDDLTQKMQELTDKVNPLLPSRKLTKGELNEWTPPKNQIKADGTPTASMVRFCQKTGAVVVGEHLVYEGKTFQIPIQQPLIESIPATIDNLDAVKMHLITLGWVPTEWRERDLTKDSKKVSLPLEKRIKALDRWYLETTEGKYTKERFKHLGLKPEQAYQRLRVRLNENKPVNVPTSPCVRVGVEKEICPNLIKLGDKVSFAKDFADYLTFKHRKSTIAGGDIEEMDFDSDSPNTGFLANYREDDGRIPTPAIEIGASTFRYRHISVANIPRASSVYGKEMRSLFGCGEGFFQFGFDFASLEARVEGHYTIKGTNGEEYAKSLTAEKPNDLHTVNADKLGISRTDAKSFKYALTYGAQVAKVMKMFSMTKQEATQLFENFWNGSPALKEEKHRVESEWIANGKKFIKGIDGRKVNIRSQHSIVNAEFQSTGVICAKYVTVLLMQKMEKLGYCINPFEGKPDVAGMIEYHDENQLAISKSIVKFKTFKTEDEANEFVAQWQGEQLSAISEGKMWYVTLPNDVSRGIDEAIKEVEELMKLNVSLGFEWIVNKNWYGCH